LTVSILSLKRKFGKVEKCCTVAVTPFEPHNKGKMIVVMAIFIESDEEVETNLGLRKNGKGAHKTQISAFQMYRLNSEKTHLTYLTRK
jgi:hypothetical protein